MFIRLTATFFALLLTFSVFANEGFDKGLSAYKAYDYDQALILLRNAAEQGHEDAHNYLAHMYHVGLGVKKDLVQAVAWYQKGATLGNADSQNYLGLWYKSGDGGKKDFEQGLFWYKKSAAQGHPQAHVNIGNMYRGGDGVKKDYLQALTWYLKADELGHKNVKISIGQMYEEGNGVKKDYMKALSWYQKGEAVGASLSELRIVDISIRLGSAYEHGTDVKKDLNKALFWYKLGPPNYTNDDINRVNLKLAALEKQQHCKKVSKTKLFNVSLKCADRDSLMSAAKKSGAVVKRESRKYWGDIYLTDKVLKGSSELYITYTLDGFFSLAQYTFPSHMDSAQITQVKSFVANKYGKPSLAKGKPSLGAVTYKWNLEDGIELKVNRGWPDTTTYLTYTYPKNHQAVIAEQEKQKKEREAKEYKTQSNAF